MAKREIDRRVARTRAVLHNALVTLILKNGYEAITVEDICEAADVGRSTFYAHYKSKEELHLSGMAHLRRQLVDRARESATLGPGGERCLGFSLPMFEHARYHIDHYRAMVGHRGGASARGHLRKLVSDMVRDELGVPGSKQSVDAMPRELVVQYVVGAYMAVLIWWLDGGAKLSPHRIDALFQNLTARGIRSGSAITRVVPMAT